MIRKNRERGGGVGVKANATMAEVEKPGRFRRIQMVVMWDLYYGLHELESARAGVTSALQVQTQRLRQRLL